MYCDCHMHMVLDSYDWQKAIARHRQTPDIAFIRQTLQAYQSRGFTYLRDGGDRWNVGKTARALAPEFGITYRTPLAPLALAGHYGSFIGTTYETLKDYLALVKSHRENGADFIKIMISGLMDFNRYGILTEDGLPATFIAELIHIAHEEGFSVMAHANGARTVEAAAKAGVDSIEHGAYLDSDALWAMKESGTVWVPTLSTVGNLRGNGRFSENAVTQIFNCAAQNILIFAQMGGLLAPGSDAGAWAVPHSSLSEYTLFQSLFQEKTEAVIAPGIRAIQNKF